MKRVYSPLNCHGQASSGNRPIIILSRRKTTRWWLHCALLRGSKAALSVLDGSGPRRMGRSSPIPPLPLHATSLALSSACSSGEGSTGGGPGYPLGKRVRLAVLITVRMKAGERRSDNRWGRSLSRKGVMKTAIMEKVEKIMVDEKRSREQLISEIMARGA